MKKGKKKSEAERMTETKAEDKNKTLTAALKYAGRGWPIFPLWGRDGDRCDCGDAECGKNAGKHPIGSLAPHGFKDATTDLKTIERWWRKYPEAGIGLATGNASGLIVLDVDIKNKKTGYGALAALQGELGQLPETKLASTPSGGRHFYFRCEESIRSSVEKLGFGLDVKADGGYVVLPPSHGLYDWVDGGTAVELPPLWVEHLRSFNNKQGYPGATPTADAAQIANALAVVPNDDVSWEEWNRVGMAAWRATGGSEEGFQAFDSWSRKSSKYNAEVTRKRWAGYSTSPPTIIRAGTIFWLAAKADPQWRKASATKDIDLDALNARLDALAQTEPGINYALERKAIKKEFKIDVQTIDHEVARRRQVNADSVLYEHWNVEPWHAPVDTVELLAAIREEIRRYVATLGERAIVPALWTMFTWVHETATHSPLLLVNSAEPDCGKTTLLGVISYLAWRPLTSVEISGPMLYRSVKKWRPTFIIDEADAILAHNDDLRAVINSGWTRGQGVVRGDPETHEPQMFSTFAPKALGMKGRDLPDTTLSRTIELTLTRKLPNEKVVDFKHEDDKPLADLRSMLARWSADNAETLRGARPKIIPGFDNRLKMNWKPLLAIAELASEKAQQLTSKAAQAIESAKYGDASLSIQLLADIRAIFDAGGEDGLRSNGLVEALIADAEKPWAQFYKGKPLSANRLAKMLRTFGITSEEIHDRYDNSSHGKGYKRERFEEAWERFLPDPEKPPVKARYRANTDEIDTSSTSETR
jgi:hypothetical protein